MLKFIRCAALLAGLFLVLGLSSTTIAARLSTRERLQQMGGTPCAGSPDYTCVTLTVPLDHFNPGDNRTINVVFGVHPATGARKGTFVYGTGGPGTSGIYLADWYGSFLRPEIFEKFDVVFFDQRGVGLSGGLNCPDAAAIYYQSDWRADTATREQKLKQAANVFADACYTQMQQPDILPYLATTQAVEDLEAFRVSIGENKFWLYGESYATQYAQTYAQAHHDHLAGMILDGTVDLTLDGVTYYARATQSFNDTLVGSLKECGSNPKCSADFGNNPVRIYDLLAQAVSAKKIPFQFPLGSGSSVTRKFDHQSLEYTGISQMYGLSGRMWFTRALAAYARDGDLVPLARLLYSDLVIDETTFQPTSDPGWSDAYYYSVECQDYGYYAGTAEERANQYIAAANPTQLSGIRLASLMWDDFPCIYWHAASQDTTRPPHWTAPGVPTLVLNSIDDPITPIESARAVYDHLNNGYLITQAGGPHVIWAYGKSCVDDPVYAFLLDDQMPAQRETACNGKIMVKYVPLAPADASSFGSPLAAMQSAETEINFLPEYANWDYVTPTRIGCNRGGFIDLHALRNRADMILVNCAFTNGWVMNGRAHYQPNRDRFVMQVGVTGEQSCTLKYERTGADSKITGVCNSAAVHANGIAENADTFAEIRHDRTNALRPRVQQQRK